MLDVVSSRLSEMFRPSTCFVTGLSADLPFLDRLDPCHLEKDMDVHTFPDLTVLIAIEYFDSVFPLFVIFINCGSEAIESGLNHLTLDDTYGILVYNDAQDAPLR